jgi:hypothetical protein
VISACVERLYECLEELKPLFEPHWQELALNKDRVPLDPQYETYLTREALGEVLCVTVREHGRVIAYFVGFVAPGLHYRTCLTLTQDILWVHPNFRASDSLSQLEEDMVAEELFREIKREAIRRGVQRVFMGAKAHSGFAQFFETQGLEETDRYFSAWWGS